MRFSLIDKILVTTFLVGLICLAVGGATHHFAEGLALFCGAFWGAINLFFLKILLKRLVLQKKDSLFFLLVLVKWPLLYFGGYTLLKMEYLSSLYLLGGFSILFGVIFIFGALSIQFGKVHEHRNP